jgi:hypothetical protein
MQNAARLTHNAGSVRRSAFSVFNYFLNTEPGLGCVINAYKP